MTTSDDQTESKNIWYQKQFFPCIKTNYAGSFYFYSRYGWYRLSDKRYDETKRMVRA